MVDKKTVGTTIVQFERVAPGILIPVGLKKSYWKDKIKNQYTPSDGDKKYE